MRQASHTEPGGSASVASLALDSTNSVRVTLTACPPLSTPLSTMPTCWPSQADRSSTASIALRPLANTVPPTADRDLTAAAGSSSLQLKVARIVGRGTEPSAGWLTASLGQAVERDRDTELGDVALHVGRLHDEQRVAQRLARQRERRAPGHPQGGWLA